METIEELTQKLLTTYGVQHQLEKLRLRAVPSLVRWIEGARTTLPLGLIPITLAWTAVVFFLPYGDSQTLIRLYALGLLAMLGGVSLLLVLRNLTGRMKLRDEVLGEMTMLTGLAYHPNTALRRSVATKGFATLADFRQWYEKQRGILENRAADFESAIATLKRNADRPLPDLDDFPPGARTFLEN